MSHDSSVGIEARLWDWASILSFPHGEEISSFLNRLYLGLEATTLCRVDTACSLPAGKVAGGIAYHLRPPSPDAENERRYTSIAILLHGVQMK